jgi:hypothetical protein
MFISYGFKDLADFSPLNPLNPGLILSEHVFHRELHDTGIQRLQHHPELG